MKKQVFIFLSLAILASSGCTNKTSINEQEAGKVIVSYLKGNPAYKIGHFQFGEIKFNNKKERMSLVQYKALASHGYITMKLLKSSKNFFGRDSSYVYQINLLDKASEWVLKQEQNKATVKVANYVLSNEKPVNFWSVNSSTAKVTVALKKINTVFAPFQKEDENSDFITKTYRLKLNPEEGWQVAK